jgi:hypothetical protein
LNKKSLRDGMRKGTTLHDFAKNIVIIVEFVDITAINSFLNFTGIEFKPLHK